MQEIAATYARLNLSSARVSISVLPGNCATDITVLYCKLFFLSEFHRTCYDPKIRILFFLKKSFCCHKLTDKFGELGLKNRCFFTGV